MWNRNTQPDPDVDPIQLLPESMIRIRTECNGFGVKRYGAAVCVNDEWMLVQEYTTGANVATPIYRDSDAEIRAVAQRFWQAYLSNTWEECQ